MMILVFWAGLMAAGFRFYMWLGIFKNPIYIVILSLTVTLTSLPIMLGFVLLFLFDRRGPVRSFYIQACQAWGGLFGSTTYLYVDFMSYILTGRPTMLFPMFPIMGLICLPATVMHLRSIWPSRCQSCGSQSVIAAALRRPIPREWRGKARRWCATCGQVYEKQGAEPWSITKSSIELDPVVLD